MAKKHQGRGLVPYVAPIKGHKKKPQKTLKAEPDLGANYACDLTDVMRQMYRAALRLAYQNGRLDERMEAAALVEVTMAEAYPEQEDDNA